MDPFAAIKSQLWGKWFDSPVPMIGGVTPRQASRTAAGQTQLDGLLAFYDQMNAKGTGEMIQANPPSKYVRWKLGYGPGSAQEFAVEGAVMGAPSSSSTAKPTARTASHTKKVEKKQAYVFVPRRCEVEGCTSDKKDTLFFCSRCTLVYYCGAEHQQADWGRWVCVFMILSQYFSYFI
jgi:hypothetical protein